MARIILLEWIMSEETITNLLRKGWSRNADGSVSHPSRLKRREIATVNPLEGIAKARRHKKAIREHGHPKGMLGKHHTWKQGWREIGGIRLYARSRWEANYARYLHFLLLAGELLKWEHEPETFWFEKERRGCVSYLPDFRVTWKGGRVEYHEVKGWMTPASATKLKRMKKYYPHVKIVLVQEGWFKANNRKLAGLVKDWET